MQIWAALLLYFFAISAIFGSSSKLDRLVLPKLFLGNPMDCMLWPKTQKPGFEKHSMR